MEALFDAELGLLGLFGGEEGRAEDDERLCSKREVLFVMSDILLMEMLTQDLKLWPCSRMQGINAFPIAFGPIPYTSPELATQL